jgi:hypothetical protein
MCPTANSDGLFKCLQPTLDSFVTSLNIYASKICSIYKMLWHPDSFISRDSTLGWLANALAPYFLLAILTISS